MALPSSGPLALSDIQTEFGGSNPIGLNEYYAGGSYVPAGTTGTYGAVPSSGTISIQQFYGTSNYTGSWITQFTFTWATGATPYYSFGTYPFQALAVDSSNNIYIGTGYTLLNTTLTTSSASSLFIKLNYNGSFNSDIVGNRSNGISYKFEPRLASVEGSGYVYFYGSATQSGLVEACTQTASGSAGALPSYTYGLGFNGVLSRRVFSDGTNICYFSGNGTGGNAITYNPGSTALTKQINIGGDGTNSADCGLIDSSGNLYVAGRVQQFRTAPATARGFFLLKLNSSGTSQWQKFFGLGGSTSASTVPYNLKLSTNGSYVYVVGYSNSNLGGNSTTYGFIAKWDTSGNLQSQNYVTTTGGLQDIVFDSSGNYYVLWNNFTNAGYTAVLKFNSSDTLQWSRTITASNTAGQTAMTGVALALNSDGSKIIITTYRVLSPYTYMAVVTVPTDGSKTGTYGGYTYAVGSFAVASGSMDTNSTSLSISAFSAGSNSYGSDTRAETLNTPTTIAL